MRNILLTVSYDGTDFCGWQRQGDCLTGHVRTVQKELEKVLAVVLKKMLQLVVQAEQIRAFTLWDRLLLLFRRLTQSLWIDTYQL